MSARTWSRWRLFTTAPWIVVMAGVLVMIVLLLTATGLFSVDRRPASAPDPVFPFVPGNTPPPAAGQGAPETPDQSTEPATRPAPTTTRPADPVTTTSRPTPSRSTISLPGAPPSRSVAPPPVPEQGSLSARYRVTNDWRGSFFAEVRIRNDSPTSRDWNVELRFPPDVERLRAHWMDGAPQPLVRRSGDTYVFTGNEPVRAGSSVLLRLQFEYDDGEDRPTVCTVNGAACTID